jgi:hypothetical protein
MNTRLHLKCFWYFILGDWHNFLNKLRVLLFLEAVCFANIIYIFAFERTPWPPIIYSSQSIVATVVGAIFIWILFSATAHVLFLITDQMVVDEDKLKRVNKIFVKPPYNTV